MDRLRTLDAALAGAAAAITDNDERRRLARHAARSVADRLNLSNQTSVQTALQVDPAALPASDRNQLSQLVDQLDEAAWEQQETGNEPEYLALFSQARAANAVLEYVQASPDGNLADVLYEAHAATGDLEYSRSLLET